MATLHVACFVSSMSVHFSAITLPLLLNNSKHSSVVLLINKWIPFSKRNIRKWTTRQQRGGISGSEKILPISLDTSLGILTKIYTPFPPHTVPETSDKKGFWIKCTADTEKRSEGDNYNTMLSRRALPPPPPKFQFGSQGGRKSSIWKNPGLGKPAAIQWETAKMLEKQHGRSRWSLQEVILVLMSCQWKIMGLQVSL